MRIQGKHYTYTAPRELACWALLPTVQLSAATQPTIVLYTSRVGRCQAVNKLTEPFRCIRTEAKMSTTAG